MGVTNRGMDSPDETRTFDHGQVEVVKIGGATIGRYTFEPGWRWSESVKPIAKTDSCQAHHVGYVLTGRLHVLSDDGGEAEIGPGKAYEIEPGHDGWVVDSLGGDGIQGIQVVVGRIAERESRGFETQTEKRPVTLETHDLGSDFAGFIRIDRVRC